MMGTLCWLELERLLSESDPKIHWRLNDLLRAGQKAKEFAAVSWSSSNESSDSSFIHWQPSNISDPDSLTADKAPDLDRAEESIAELPELISQDQIDQNSAIQAAISQARKEAFDAGFSDGSDTVDTKYEALRQELQNFITSLEVYQSDVQSFYDPLKKLAIHIAEQIVRGELTLSSTAIEHLVQKALGDIEHQGIDNIVVTLNPKDADAFIKSLNDGPEVRADPELSRGSVKVTMGDAAIEDLIEHRIKGIADSIFQLDTENYSGNRGLDSNKDVQISDDQTELQDTVLRDEQSETTPLDVEERSDLGEDIEDSDQDA